MSGRSVQKVQHRSVNWRIGGEYVYVERYLGNYDDAELSDMKM